MKKSRLHLRKLFVARRMLYLMLALAVVSAVQPALAQSRIVHQGSAGTRVGDPRAKIHPHLLDDIQLQASAPQSQAGNTAQPAAHDIEFIARIFAGTDLSPYVSKWFARPFIMPDGTTVAYGLASAGGLLKLAALDDVLYLQRPESLTEAPKPLDEPQQQALNAMIQSQIDTSIETDLGPQSNGWYDTSPSVHGSRQAWANGYTGKGVRLMINDSGADYCHPDLYKTWGYIEDKTSPYYGLPEMFDSYSGYLAARDYRLGQTNIAGGAADYADTSTTVRGPMAIFQPIGADTAHGYKLPSNSKSGIYHIGSHPDKTLAAAAADISAKLGGSGVKGERAAILVVDSKEAGVYDRVYVDLNYNFDFTDDRPARLDRKFAYHEVACYDYNHDNLFDISGGLVYFIADGHTSVPTLDWNWQIPATHFGNGDLVAFAIADAQEEGGDHGTLSTSAAVGRARVRGSINSGTARLPQAGGQGLVRGPGRRVISVQNGNQYLSPFPEDAFIFAAVGYDGKVGTSDDIQIVANPWTWSATTNSFDFTSRLLDRINRRLNPQMAFVFAAGDGAPGYGTLALPLPTNGIVAGASALYDQSGIYEPIASAQQIVGGDPLPSSGRGPSFSGSAGIDVIATGEGPASLALNINLSLDGSVATTTFSGTSMAASVAAGNLALIFQAWKERTGAWPTFDQAKAVLMSSAADTNNDVYTQGAGLVNAAVGTNVAAGRMGAYVMPSSWQVGDFRGQEFASFPRIIRRGAADSQIFTLYNTSDTPVAVTIGADRLKQIGVKDYSFASADVSLDHGEFTVPDYIRRIDQDIPAGTDLIQVQQVIPYSQFNPSGSLTSNAAYNRWGVELLSWTDLNKNGMFWQDADANGKVSVSYDSQDKLAGSELDRQELVRFNYDTQVGSAHEVRVGNPLQRRKEGIVLGVQHIGRLSSIPQTNLTIEASFWQQEQWDWVSTSQNTLTIPPHSSADFVATIHVPEDADAGMYEGRIVARYSPAKSSRQQTMVIPVSAAVTAQRSSVRFGTTDNPTQPMLYDNSKLFGFSHYNGRQESGDWRLYWTDVQTDELILDGETYLLAGSRWQGGQSDIDITLLGPTEDCFSNGVKCLGKVNGGLPALYGPYAMAPIAASVNTFVDTGGYGYQTSSGGPYELVGAPVRPGLHAVLLHQVGIDGGTIGEPISGSISLATVRPKVVEANSSNSATIAFTSEIELGQFVATGFGLSQATSTSEQITQDGPRVEEAKFVRNLSLNDVGEATVTISSTVDDLDIDLYMLKKDETSTRAVAFSATPDSSNESVHLSLPADGNYAILIHGKRVPTGTASFTLTIDVAQGNDFTISNLPASIPAGGSAAITVGWNTSGKAPGVYHGLIVAGPKEAPTLFKVPVKVVVP